MVPLDKHPLFSPKIHCPWNLYNQNPNGPESQAAAFPYVYCLLSFKETVHYSLALQAIFSVAEEYGIENFEPLEIISDL